jgi:hypothetical protein
VPICGIDGHECGLVVCSDCNPPNNLYISKIDPATIELHNPTSESISTRGLFLTTDVSKKLWKIPAMVVRPGESVRVNVNVPADTAKKRTRANFNWDVGDVLYLVSS